MTIEGILSLSDPVWSLLHIAMHLGVKESVALRVVNQQGFPSPIVNTKRNRRWLAQDVRTYFEIKSQGAMSQETSLRVNPAYQPKVISFMKAK